MPQNPLIPAGYDLAWTAVCVVMLALLLWALVSLARHAKALTATQALAWTLVAILVPVVGPLCWLFIGRRATSPRAASPSAAERRA